MSKQQMSSQRYTDLHIHDDKDKRVSRHELDRSDLEINLQNKDKLLKLIDKKNKELYEENKRLKKEKDEALSRLSAIAGQKLTKGNPAITDLGNPNRPSKIGERWSSLYTDEWTDAYEELRDNNKKRNQDNVSEKELLRDTDWCYRKCSALADDQLEQIKPLLQGLTSILSLQELQSNNESTSSDACFDDEEHRETMQSFVEHFISQRQNNKRLVETVMNVCRKDFESTNPDVGPNEIMFVEKCCELCWYMLISDPPMVIEYENLETTGINSNKFNKYDKSGTTVEYVVWPVLLLHKDGPVLAKGTVQTFDDKGNVKSNAKIIQT